MENKFSTFNEIQHKPLRVFNRVVMANNILIDSGKAALEEYYTNFNSNERMEMVSVMAFMKQFGYEETKRVVTKDLVLPEEQSWH